MSQAQAVATKQDKPPLSAASLPKTYRAVMDVLAAGGWIESDRFGRGTLRYVVRDAQGAASDARATTATVSALADGGWIGWQVARRGSRGVPTMAAWAALAPDSDGARAAAHRAMVERCARKAGLGGTDTDALIAFLSHVQAEQASAQASGPGCHHG